MNPQKILNHLKNIYHYALAFFGNILYWFPSRDIFVLGITGTKGKSSTIELINAVLESAGYKTAIISSLRFKTDKENQKNDTSMTMPGRFFIQRLLRKAADRGCRYALVEVTSQGVLQHRHSFIDWDAALITNLNPEHIEAHGSFENYRQAKVRFFEYVAHHSRKQPKLFFINDMDRWKEYFAVAANGSGEVRYFSRENFIDKELNTGKESIGNWLSSQFNLENAAAAAAFADSQKIPWAIVKKTFKNFKGVPGRLEYVQREPFAVVIDYAHTPDSLEKIYQALTKPKTKLICVLGAAGGGRDKWKRPVMGKIAYEYCRQIVLTDEDPYDENPEAIIGEIESGFPSGRKNSGKEQKYWKILNRREAIKQAISLAKKGDTVIITGKGNESWLHAAGGKNIPWSERKVVEDLLI